MTEPWIPEIEEAIALAAETVCASGVVMAAIGEKELADNLGAGTLKRLIEVRLQNAKRQAIRNKLHDDEVVVVVMPIVVRA